MALDVQWYDFVCFGIVGVAFFGSLWVLWRKEGSRSRSSDEDDDTSFFQSLLSGHPVGTLVSPSVGHVRTDQLWSSCWKGVHPGWLLGTRLVSFLIMAGFLTRDMVDWGASIYVYYTEWTFTLAMVYFAIGTFISAYGCWVCSHQEAASENGATNGVHDVEETVNTITTNAFKERHINSTKLRRRYTGEEEFLQGAGFWGYIMQTTYQASAGAVVITDMVFWCVIVPFLSTARLGLNWLMGCMHTLNALFLLIDTALNSLPFPWFRLAYFVLWTCIYVIFQWVLHAFGFSWWPYPFLDLDTPWAPVWYFSLAVLHIPCYGIYALIFKAKNTILPRLFPRSFLRSH